MKRLHIVKTIELILLTAFAIYCVFTVRTSHELSGLMTEYPEVRWLFYALWGLIAGIFVMFFIDFGVITRGQRKMAEMRMALHSDPLSQVANRNGCDELIDKYTGKTLPAGFTCAMLTLTNIYEINEQYGRAEGNQAIRDFSTILHMAARGIGFVGRNGGNKFLLLFEDSQGEEECAQCLERIRVKVEEYNSTGVKLSYSYGQTVSREGDGRAIHELIAQADRDIKGGIMETQDADQKGAEPEDDL